MVLLIIISISGLMNSQFIIPLYCPYPIYQSTHVAALLFDEQIDHSILILNSFVVGANVEDWSHALFQIF